MWKTLHEIVINWRIRWNEIYMPTARKKNTHRMNNDNYNNNNSISRSISQKKPLLCESKSARIVFSIVSITRVGYVSSNSFLTFIKSAVYLSFFVCCEFETFIIVSAISTLILVWFGFERFLKIEMNIPISINSIQSNPFTQTNKPHIQNIDIYYIYLFSMANRRFLWINRIMTKFVLNGFVNIMYIYDAKSVRKFALPYSHSLTHSLTHSRTQASKLIHKPMHTSRYETRISNIMWKRIFRMFWLFYGNKVFGNAKANG